MAALQALWEILCIALCLVVFDPLTVVAWTAPPAEAAPPVLGAPPPPPLPQRSLPAYMDPALAAPSDPLHLGSTSWAAALQAGALQEIQFLLWATVWGAQPAAQMCHTLAPTAPVHHWMTEGQQACADMVEHRLHRDAVVILHIAMLAGLAWCAAWTLTLAYRVMCAGVDSCVWYTCFRRPPPPPQRRVVPAAAQVQPYRAHKVTRSVHRRDHLPAHRSRQHSVRRQTPPSAGLHPPFPVSPGRSHSWPRSHCDDDVYNVSGYDGGGRDYMSPIRILDAQSQQCVLAATRVSPDSMLTASVTSTASSAYEEALAVLQRQPWMRAP